MRIGLITVHVGANFGSVLQTIATAKILSDLGNDVEVINYVPPRTTILGYIRDRKGFASKVKAIASLPIMGFNKKIYGGFLKKHTKLTREFYKKEDIGKNLHYDAYIIGSDQVWNSIHNQGIDLVYYLDFNSPGKHISFSSSFGREKLPSDEFAKVKELLSSFSYLSAREDTGVKLLKEMGFKNSIQTIDPTFLLTKDDWRNYASPKLINEKYLLIYTPYNIIDQNEINHVAKIIAEERGLKIITFGWDIRKDSMADKTILFASPGDFLSLMMYADFIITNSFHGTAFSIILKKQFVVLTPSHFSTRIYSILKLLGLTDRLITKDSDFLTIMEQQINYVEGNKAIELERHKAIDYLKKAISI